MKTLKLKYQSITFLASVCMLFLMPGQSFAQTTASANTATTTTPTAIQQEKTDVKSLVGSVRYERARITSLRKKYRADKNAGLEMATLEDQKQLMRAYGDLKMAKAYLAAEKEMFIQSYNLAIRSQRDAVNNDKRKLATARLRLDQDIAAINEKSDKDAMAVIRYEKDLARDNETLSNTRIAKDSDILAINKEIKKENGEFVGSIYAENAMASTEKWLEK